MPEPLATHDMRGNLMLAMCIFIASIILLPWVQLRATHRRRNAWFPVYVFATGPLVACAWFVFDWLLVPNESYISWTEAATNFCSVLIIGVFVGTISVVAAYIEARTRRPPISHADEDGVPPNGT